MRATLIKRAWRLAAVCGLMGATLAHAANPVCTDKIPDAIAATQVVSNGFGLDIANSRNQASEITAANVGSLKLALTHVAAGSKEKRAAPAITNQAVFVAEGRDVVAYNRATGCEYWRFSAVDKFGLLVGSNAIRTSSIFLVPTSLGRPPLIFAGDFYANLYALDARTGRRYWSKFIGTESAYHWTTGSPTLYNGVLYVPVATKEVVTTVLNVFTPCCKSHGLLQAMDPYTGKIKWTYHTATTNSYDAKTGFAGPSGMSLWGVPAIDVANKAIVIGTGQNLGPPTTTNSDSIVSLDMATGAVRWVYQAVSGDAWNGACEAPIGFNGHCPKNPGRDLDFGAAPIMVTLPSGAQAVLAGGKNGVVYQLDPKTGALIWKQQLGVGGNLGGVHWGMAIDKKNVYVAISDIDSVAGVVTPVAGATPGLYALDLVTGQKVWERHDTHKGQSSGKDVDSIYSTSVTVTNDVLLAANLNGEVVALRTTDGAELWRFNTAINVTDVGGTKGNGGTIDSVGPIPAGREVYLNSGYSTFGGASDWMAGPGNALFVFRLP
ncbi:MAG: hypothetical protein RI907_543 [Pseudomonadota bacterium]